MNDLTDLCLRYMDGDLSEQEAQAFSKLIAESPEAARVLSQLAIDEHHFQTTSPVVSSDVFAELLRKEQQAPVLEQGVHDETQSDPAEGSHIFREAFEVVADLDFARFVARKFVRTKAAKGLAAAAVIAIGMLLFVLFSGPSNTPSVAPLASTPEIDQTINIVATLTAEHDAQWAEGALVTGSSLKTGQTLKLTQGFAEITTSRGAVAILEAPCSVEMIDNDNAIRLNAGKLVGVCRAPASEGFTVHTPVAKVRDIGTRFGIQHANGQTQVSVLNGKVEAIALGQDGSSWSDLIAGQHAKITAGLGEVVRIDQPTTGYVYDWVAVANQPRLTGQAIYKSAMPASLVPGDYEGNRPVVFAEQTNIKLPAGFEVTFVSPGEYEHNRAFEPVPLGEGTIVDCYFVHFDLPDRPDQIVTRTATLHFDRPIAGVITLPEHLLASGNLLDRPDVTYRQAVVPEGDPAVEGLDFTDTIRISADRKTLAFELSSGLYADQFRVLVQSDQGEPE